MSSLHPISFSSDNSSSAPSWHSTDIEQVCSFLDSSSEGLSEQEAQSRMQAFGPNILPKGKSESPLELLWRQINNPLIYVLLASATLAVITGKILDGIVVLAVVILNAIIGFIQEYKAGKAIDALADLVPENCSVIRNGLRVNASVSSLVPGDIVALGAGDKVPADIRLFSVSSLSIDESALTGESLPSVKQFETVSEEASLGDRVNMAYSGTIVTRGSAEGMVVTTALKTELGRISSMLEGTSRLQTPLTLALEKVSSVISWAIVAVSLLLMAFGLWRGYSVFDSLLAAITLAVAAIPEGLPAIITIALAIGVKRMARRHAIIRRLPAVETLGSTTVICTDKTGTLTKNEMTVREILAGDTVYQFSGVGYAPEGELLMKESKVENIPPAVEPLLRAGALCNDAALQEVEAEWQLSGDPTEGALLVSSAKAGLDYQALRSLNPRKDALPFDSEHQYMATLHQTNEHTHILYLKGAPEVILPKCSSDAYSNSFQAQRVHQEVERMAWQGMRVLAFACIETTQTKIQSVLEQTESNFRFLGLQGMIDPPRPEAIAAVQACRGAGITVKMITGDHLVTAQAIGREFGLLSQAGALSGSQLSELSDQDFDLAAAQVNVFARVAPEHKLRLVRSLQKQGQVVAMTGDGVNDAPALKQANIGVAMGLAGTAAAREAADIVLTDDNFSSIAAAVEEGRRVYDNLTKALAFVLPTNLGEALIILVAVLFFPMSGAQILMPITPVQILWINLVATVTLALPLGFEAMEPSVMKRRPRDPKARVLGKFVIIRTLVVTILIALAGVGLFLWEYNTQLHNQSGAQLALRQAQTMAVTTVILMQIFYLLNCRSLRHTVFRIGLFSNPSIYIGIGLLLLFQAAFIYLPVMNQLFSSAPLDLEAWGKSTLCAASVLPVIALEKWLLAFFRRRQHNNHKTA